MNKLFTFVGLVALLFATEASEKMVHSRSQLRNIQEDCKILDTYSNASTIPKILEENLCDCEEEESNIALPAASKVSEGMDQNDAETTKPNSFCLDTIGKINILQIYMGATTVPRTIEEILC